MSKEISLTLPVPPTVNSAFATNWTTKRRFKSKKYVEWIEEASIAMLSQSKFFIKGDEWLAVEYNFYMPIYTKKGDKRVLDVSNREKALSDFLASQIEGFEDHKIKTIIMTKHESNREEVDIIVREMPNVI